MPHYSAVFFPRASVEHARVAKQTTSRDSIQPMIYLQSSYVQTSVKGYIQLFTNEKKLYTRTLKTENLDI